MTPLLNTWVATVSPPAVSVSPHMIPFFIFVYVLYLFLVYFLYLGKQNRATNPVSQEHLGQGLFVGQQSRKSISGNLRRKCWLVHNVKLIQLMNFDSGPGWSTYLGKSIIRGSKDGHGLGSSNNIHKICCLYSRNHSGESKRLIVVLSSLNSNWDIINHWETAVLVKAPTLSEEKSHVDGFMTSRNILSVSV